MPSEPYIARTVRRGCWLYEWIQFDGHYVVKTYTIEAGGKRHYEGSERHDGKAPTEVKEAKPKPVQPEQPARVETMKEAILRREEQDAYRRERARNDIYSKERS